MSGESSAYPRWPFSAAAAVVVIGVAAAFGWANLALVRQTDAVNEFTTLPPMSGLPVVVEEPGLYTIWAATGCSGFCRPDPAELFREHMTVSFEGPGGVVEPVPRDDEQHYMISGSREGRSVWTVEFPEAGTYVMTRVRREGVGPASLLLGKGDGIPAGIMPGAMIIGVVTGAVALALVGYGAHRRSQAVQAMIAAIEGR